MASDSQFSCDTKPSPLPVSEAAEADTHCEKEAAERQRLVESTSGPHSHSGKRYNMGCLRIHFISPLYITVTFCNYSSINKIFNDIKKF